MPTTLERRLSYPLKARIMVALESPSSPLLFYKDQEGKPSHPAFLEKDSLLSESLLAALKKLAPQLNLTRNTLTIYPYEIELDKAQEPERLFLTKVHKDTFSQDLPWKPLPDLLRKMGKHPDRIAYMKAWQVYMGAVENHLEAYEIRKK